MLESNIQERYAKHSLSRLCQGDLFVQLPLNLFVSNSEGGAVVEYTFPYAVLVSQDCDLEQEFRARLKQETAAANGTPPPPFSSFQPNVLVLPAFRDELLHQGIHLKEIYGVTAPKLDRDIWKRVVSNNDERYHTLEEARSLNIPQLVIDFKTYLSVPKENLEKLLADHYVATINELFRENLAIRFANYMSRIALPELASTSATSSVNPLPNAASPSHSNTTPENPSAI